MSKNAKIQIEKSIIDSVTKIGAEQRKAMEAISAQLDPSKKLMDSLSPFFKQQELMASAIQKAMPDMSALTKAMLPNAAMIGAIQKAIEPTANVHKAIEKLIKPIFDPTFIEKIRKHQEESDQRTTELRDTLKAHKIFLTPFLAENTYDTVLIQEIKSYGNDAWKYFDDQFSQEETIAQLKDFWNKNPIYKPRMKVLGRALDAHLAKDYVVSIPLFLMQMDGIIIDIYPGLKTMAARKNQIAATKPAPDTSTKMIPVFQEIMGETVISDVVCHEMFQTWFPGDPLTRNTYPNRHQILHGGDLSYADEPYSSLRCLLIVDGLEILNNLINPKPTVP